MSNDSFKHNRRSIRLRDYDYTLAGAYFVTIVTKDRECLFGDVADDEMQMNAIGEIVVEEWLRSSQIRKEIELDEYIVMPNHLHGIVVIMSNDDEKAHHRAPLQATLRRPARCLGSLVAGFKAATAKRINEYRHIPGAPVWQRNYYEHVIRGEKTLNAIREYIAGNPANWARDEENPGRL